MFERLSELRPDPIGFERGGGSQLPFISDRAESHARQPRACFGLAEPSCERGEKLGWYIADVLRRLRTICIGLGNYAQRDTRLLQWGRGGVQANNCRIKVGASFRINCRDLTLPRVSNGLTELADIMSVVTEMNRELLPT